MSAPSDADIIGRALARTKARGAAAADAVLIRSESSEARVRGQEIEFVKQAHGRGLGIRVLFRDTTRSEPGLSSALTSTSDLSPEAIRWGLAFSVTGVLSIVAILSLMRVRAPVPRIASSSDS